MRMHTDPRGEAYRQVIDLAIQHSEYFVLSEKINPEYIERTKYANVLKALEPFLVKTIVLAEDAREEIIQTSKMYQSHAFYSSGTYYLYECCEKSGRILKETANRLSDWDYPALPEDLCFIKSSGGDYLYSIVHEHMYGLDVTEEEACELMDQISGLFMPLSAHKELKHLLDDAIKHQTDRLYISGHGLTELSERIRELTELRELEIFEQDLYRLPEALFALCKLEHLKLYTADLESIPSTIAGLKNLKTLSINCGSSDRPVKGWKPKPKQQISLNHIPPEIGQLTQLEILTIHYTAIHKLPNELVNLQQLKVLNLENCLIAEEPTFLHEMPQLKQINLAQKSPWELVPYEVWSEE